MDRPSLAGFNDAGEFHLGPCSIVSRNGSSGIEFGEEGGDIGDENLITVLGRNIRIEVVDSGGKATKVVSGYSFGNAIFSCQGNRPVTGDRLDATDDGLSSGHTHLGFLLFTEVKNRVEGLIRVVGAGSLGKNVDDDRGICHPILRDRSSTEDHGVFISDDFSFIPGWCHGFGDVEEGGVVR